MVGSCCLISVNGLEQALAGTGATSWLPPSARTAVPAIKDVYFLCLVNAKLF